MLLPQMQSKSSNIRKITHRKLIFLSNKTPRGVHEGGILNMQLCLPLATTGTAEKLFSLLLIA